MFSSFPISHFARHSSYPEYIGAGADTSAASFSVNTACPTPAGVRAQDVLIAFVFGHDCDEINAPGGWSILHESEDFSREGEFRSHGVYYRVAVSGEPSTHTWGLSANAFFGTVYGGSVIVAYRRASVKKVPLFDVDETAAGGVTSHNYLIHAQIKDQYGVVVTGWHSMRGSDTPAVASSAMTALAGASASIGGGGYSAGVDCYEQRVLVPSDLSGGLGVSVDYDLSCDADTLTVFLEGRFA